MTASGKVGVQLQLFEFGRSRSGIDGDGVDALDCIIIFETE